MSEQTTEQIIELAQQKIAARKNRTIEQRGLRELPWRYAFLGLFGALLLGLIAWPGMPLDQKMYAVGHGICAQVHTVQMGGLTLPICARNTGIYSSFVVSSLFLLALGRRRAAKLPPWTICAALVLFVGFMAVDGFNSMFVDLFLPHLYTPRNEIRTLTGIGMGTAVAVVLFLILNLSLRRDPDTELPVIKNWRELAGIVLLNFLVLLAMYGNVSFMYWPIAISAWSGIIGVLFCVNLLLTALFMGYEGEVLRVVQLAKPATAALIFTVIEIGTLSILRFWLENQGLITIS